MKQYIIFAVILALLVPFVSASPFSTSFSAIDNEILPNETAVFELAISNFGATQSRYQVYTIDPNWVFKTDPVSVVVPAGTSRTFTITLKPKTNVAFGSQGIAVNVRDTETNDAIQKNLFVALKNYDGITGTFRTSIAFDVAVPQNIDPREPVPLTIHLRNRNALDIKDMRLTISSPHFSHEKVMDLGPVAEDTQYLSMELDPQEASGEYLLIGKIYYRDSLVTQIQKAYSIGAYADITQEREERSFLLRSTNEITLSNDGNTEKTVMATAPANILDRLFSSTEPDAKYDQGQYVWAVTVPPGETVTVTHAKNYRYFTIIVLLLLVGVFAYFRYRSPLVVLKEAVGSVKGEGMSDLKIRVFVKNRTNKVIQGVEIYDKVPRIADVKKTHEVGTLKPNAVKNLKSGTLMQWNLDVLEPYEERILTYSVKSKLKIVGKVSMPQAKVKFETDRGQERVVFSNNILVVETK